jgi:hypothetical protein
LIDPMGSEVFKIPYIHTHMTSSSRCKKCSRPQCVNVLRWTRPREAKQKHTPLRHTISDNRIHQSSFVETPGLHLACRLLRRPRSAAAASRTCEPPSVALNCHRTRSALPDLFPKTGRARLRSYPQPFLSLWAAPQSSG